MSQFPNGMRGNVQIQGEPFQVLSQDPAFPFCTTVILAIPGWTEPLLESYYPRLGVNLDQPHLVVVCDGFSQVNFAQNDQGLEVCAVRLPFDSLSENPSVRQTLLSISNLLMIGFAAPLNPPRLFHNLDQYMADIVSLLNSFNSLRHVVLPLDLSGRTTSIFAALRGHPYLSTLDVRLPESYEPTPDDLGRFRFLLSIELFGFDQIQTLVIDVQLLDSVVLGTISSLEGLQELHILPQGNDGGDLFVIALSPFAGNRPFTNGFFRLTTIIVDVENTSSWAVNKLQHIFPNVEIL